MAVIKLTIIFISFFIALISERIFPFVVKTRHSLSDYFKNFSLFGVNAFISMIIVLPVTAWASSFNIWERGDSLAIILLLHILILDFWIYWWHRAMHYFNFLWRFHQVHHLDETLDTSSAVRFHFGEVICSAFVRVPIIVALSIPFFDILIFEAILLTCSFFQHANIKLPKKLESMLSYIIVTPSIHWIHHRADAVDMHTNFCLFISIWDRLFGSSSVTPRTKDMKIGLPKQNDKSLIALLLLPFQPR